MVKNRICQKQLALCQHGLLSILSGYDYNATSTVIRNGTSYHFIFISLDTMKAVVPLILVFVLNKHLGQRNLHTDYVHTKISPLTRMTTDSYAFIHYLTIIAYIRFFPESEVKNHSNHTENDTERTQANKNNGYPKEYAHILFIRYAVRWHPFCNNERKLV